MYGRSFSDDAKYDNFLFEMHILMWELHHEWNIESMYEML